jgi:hypothetical protein
MVQKVHLRALHHPLICLSAPAADAPRSQWTPQRHAPQRGGSSVYPHLLLTRPDRNGLIDGMRLREAARHICLSAPVADTPRSQWVPRQHAPQRGSTARHALGAGALHARRRRRRQHLQMDKAPQGGSTARLSICTWRCRQHLQIDRAPGR